ncbi:MAG: IS21 family transposase [Ardenticatenia bacterium]|nr:IS21 family transposase [Ardenticatenia bacterium]
MIDYETYCKVVQLHQQHQLKPTQIARMLALDVRTVLHWLEEGTYRPRHSPRRPSKLDPYKPRILSWLEGYQYTGVQILMRLREDGYEGGTTILNDYIAKIRPRKLKAYLTLSFAPGECAQVDWGQYGSVPAGNTHRRLSFFVMVLCYSRMMYVEFTVSQSMEHFLACHQNAFNFFGAVPENIMVDNLKSAVIRRLIGQAPVFNPRYRDFANHFGFTIKACGVGKGNEKGRVENAVGYIKKNFLGGLDIPDFSAVNPAARHWLDTVANVRVHGATRKKPVQLFKVERPAMRSLPERPYEVAVTRPARATNRFRVILDTNRYSVPAEYAGQRLMLKAYPDRICIYHNARLIAQHPRSYDRNQDFENPDHPKALLAQRHAAREQRLLMRFLTLSPKAEAYYQHLRERRMNPRHHIRQIVALSEIYSAEKVARAIEDAFTFQAFSCEYIANILEQRERLLPEPGALHLTRRQDLLDIELSEPDLSIYEADNDQPQGEPEDEHEEEPQADR